MENCQGWFERATIISGPLSIAVSPLTVSALLMSWFRAKTDKVFLKSSIDDVIPMKRMFFALCPNDETRDKVVKLTRAIKKERLRKVRADNIHITLVFLGDVDASQEQSLRTRAGDIIAPAMDILFDRLALWRRPGILSLTCSHPPQPLLDLVAELTRMAVGCDIDVDTRPYKAHVTLARKARFKPEIEFQPLSWPADRFALMESVSTDLGVQYRIVQSWPLTAGN